MSDRASRIASLGLLPFFLHQSDNGPASEPGLKVILSFITDSSRRLFATPPRAFQQPPQTIRCIRSRRFRSGFLAGLALSLQTLVGSQVPLLLSRDFVRRLELLAGVLRSWLQNSVRDTCRSFAGHPSRVVIHGSNCRTICKGSLAICVENGNSRHTDGAEGNGETLANQAGVPASDNRTTGKNRSRPKQQPT